MTFYLVKLYLYSRLPVLGKLAIPFVNSVNRAFSVAEFVRDLTRGVKMAFSEKAFQPEINRCIKNAACSVAGVCVVW